MVSIDNVRSRKLKQINKDTTCISVTILINTTADAITCIGLKLAIKAVRKLGLIISEELNMGNGKHRKQWFSSAMSDQDN